jgi:tetratricopeptide (TPR) repeat protein
MRADVAHFNILSYRLLAVTLCLSAKSACATDFSQAQQTYVPPTYINRYDAAALGQGNASAGIIDPSLGFISSPDSISSPANFSISGLTAAASQAANFPGLSNIKTSLQKMLQQGKLGQAEALVSKYYKDIPSPLLSQVSSAATTAAQNYLQNHDLGSAGDQIRQALSDDPSNKTAQSVYGQILKAAGYNPNSASDHVTMGNDLFSQGKYSEAYLEYNKSLTISPTAEAHVGLGNLAYAQGNVALARAEYEKALAVNPKSSSAYRQRGLLKYVLQDTVGANSDLSKALVLTPDDRSSGEALLDLWRRQVALNPSEPNGHLGLARAYMLTSDLDSARSEYQTVAALDPNNASLPAARNSFRLALSKCEADKSFQAAKTLDNQGATNEAHKKIDEAIAYYPHDVNMLLYDGKLSEKLGLYDEAHQVYLAVLKEDPKNAHAASRLKRLPTGISENVSAKIEKTQPTGAGVNLAPPPGAIDTLVPETPTIAPLNQLRTAPVPQPSAQPNYIDQIPLRGIESIGSTQCSPEISNLANFMASLRNLAMMQQLQIREIDRVNKESLKAAQSRLAQTASASNLISPTPPSLASSLPVIDPALGF